MPKVFNFLKYAYPRGVKCLFTNINKQWNNFLVLKLVNFLGKYKLYG